MVILWPRISKKWCALSRQLGDHFPPGHHLHQELEMELRRVLQSFHEKLDDLRPLSGTISHWHGGCLYTTQTTGVAQTQTRFKVFLWNDIPSGNVAMGFHFTATTGDVVTVISPPRGRPYFHATWSREDPVSPVPSLKHSWGFILSVPSVQGIFSQGGVMVVYCMVESKKTP